MTLSRASLFFFILLIIATASGSTASAKELADMGRAEKILYFLDQYRAKATALGEIEDFPQIEPGKCGLPAVLHLQHLQERYGKIAGLDEVLFRPDEDLPETYDSPGGYFKIHYTTESGNSDAVDPFWGDNNSNGINDYIDNTARIADSVWEHHINDLGYVAPKSDEGLGGDARYDIYISDLSALYYGITTSDEGTGFSRSSYLELDNHYERYPGYEDRPLDALRVTMAHEFFHAIHFTYDVSEYLVGPSGPVKVHWFEMSGTWMEEETYDQVNDYYFYLPSYLSFVHRSPEDVDPSQLSIYGACLFPLFLSEKYGPDINRIAWENCADEPFENFFINAIQDAITEVSGGADTFEEVWVEYTQALYFTGDRARPGVGFEEAANYAMIPETLGNPTRDYIHIWRDYPITAEQSRDNAFPPSELGTNYHVFRTASLDSTFGMQFQGAASSSPPIQWRLSVLGFDRFNQSGQLRNFGVFENREPININNLTGITDILVAATVANPEAIFLNQASFAYQFIVADTSIEFESDEISYGPSKFDVDGGDDFRVFLRLTESQTIEISFFNVAGEVVYEESVDVTAGERQEFRWDGRNQEGKEVASGIYILQVRKGEDVEHYKILVL